MVGGVAGRAVGCDAGGRDEGIIEEARRRVTQRAPEAPSCQRRRRARWRGDAVGGRRVIDGELAIAACGPSQQICRVLGDRADGLSRRIVGASDARLRLRRATFELHLGLVRELEGEIEDL